MNFASDNTAGVAPEIMAALARANDGFALGYGNDDWTRRVEKKFAELFQRELAVFLVPTGTGANALALAHVTPPWGAVLCHEGAHIATDECGAPEFFGGGIKLVGLPGEGGKIAAATLKASLEKSSQWGAPHHVTPAAVSLSQATEAGTIYRPHEIRDIADIAHAHGAVLHMDGARLGNALARRAVIRRDQGRRHGRRSGHLLRPKSRRGHVGAAQARWAASFQAPLHRCADGGLP
jgi:threonine aldolase